MKIHTYIRTYKPTYTDTKMYIHPCGYMQYIRMYLQLYNYTLYIRITILKYMYIHVHPCIQIYVCRYIHTYMHTYIHIYIHIYIYTYIHIYIHTGNSMSHIFTVE